MECQKCMEENAYLLKHNGYGYGYIGKRFDCIRHNAPPQKNEQSFKSNIFTDHKRYYKSSRNNARLQFN